MSDPSTVEDRLASLEREVAELRRRLDTGNAGRHWLESLAGSQTDPDFQEVLRLGREARASDRPVDHDGA